MAEYGLREGELSSGVSGSHAIDFESINLVFLVFL
jgi:hypothetical protein